MYSWIPRSAFSPTLDMGKAREGDLADGGHDSWIVGATIQASVNERTMGQIQLLGELKHRQLLSRDLDKVDRVCAVYFVVIRLLQNAPR